MIGPSGLGRPVGRDDPRVIQQSVYDWAMPLHKCEQSREPAPLVGRQLTPRRMAGEPSYALLFERPLQNERKRLIFRPRPDRRFDLRQTPPFTECVKEVQIERQTLPMI